MLNTLLTSHSRAAVFEALFDGQDREMYLREIERVTGKAVRSIQKELEHLLSIDLITKRKDGNRAYFKANKKNPIYSDIVSIVEKTVGVVGQLKDRLTQDESIKCAFIFGSFARGEERSESDIDLLIVGDLGMRKVSKLLSGMQEQIGREINPHVYSPEEFIEKTINKDHFVTNITNSKIKPIIGDINEYRNE